MKLHLKKNRISHKKNAPTIPILISYVTEFEICQIVTVLNLRTRKNATVEAKIVYHFLS